MSKLSETLMPATGIATVFAASVKNAPLIPPVEKVFASEQGHRHKSYKDPNNVVFSKDGKTQDLDDGHPIIDTLA